MHSASAYAKWFDDYDAAGWTGGSASVLWLDFEELTALTIVVLVTAGIIERPPLGMALTRSPADILALVRWNADPMIRTVAGFFVNL